MFHDASRTLQDRFDTRRVADRIDELLVKDSISDADQEFIERADMFFLATADEHGHPDCSYKGGDPGLVHVLDDQTIAFPNCPRYIHRYEFVRRSSFVPRPHRTTPIPTWKRSDWAVDTLPAGDPAADPTREVLDR
jgi:predicted pyridoxine 5'-phosphate oxidase superfamily flavin-nucleotide-binding protein